VSTDNQARLPGRLRQEDLLITRINTIQYFLEEVHSEISKVDELSESHIVQLCFDPNRQIIGGIPYRNLVIKLSEEAVVKIWFARFS
jgi:hypothetical protein